MSKVFNKAETKNKDISLGDTSFYFFKDADGTPKGPYVGQVIAISENEEGHEAFDITVCARDGIGTVLDAPYSKTPKTDHFCTREDFLEFERSKNLEDYSV